MGISARKEQSEGLSYPKLIISILLSLIIWTWLWKSHWFAIVLVVSILVHEYGHYWWMGCEGIKKRDMMMVPPFGAVAISKEGWLGKRAVEARIALAGPVFGLLSLLMFVLLLVLTQEPVWAASAFLVCYINLFNLMPVAILDGGRVTKSLVVSVHPALETAFNVASVIFILAIFIFVSPIFGILIFFFWWSEFSFYRRARNFEHIEKPLLRSLEQLKGEVPLFKERYAPVDYFMTDLEKAEKKMQPLANPTLMSREEIVRCSILYIAVVGTYFTVLFRMAKLLGVPLRFSLDLINYF